MHSDFSFMGFVCSLILFQITVFFYAFAQFYGVGSQIKDMALKDIIKIRKEIMRPYLETQRLEEDKKIEHQSTAFKSCGSILIWVEIYLINLLFITFGFFKRYWFFILVGQYGIYEVTRQFAKLYPPHIESKFLMFTFMTAFIGNFAMA